MLTIESIVQLITQPWMVGVFVSIILLVAARPLYLSIFSIRAVNQDVINATAILASLGKNKQDEFYTQFKTVNTQIAKISGLSHTWREFVDSMYFESPASANPHKKVYLSHRPSHYFTRDAVLGTRLNLSQFFAYPNYLIGIGLTFTFIGLAAALHVAQAGLSSGAEQQALKDLLAVASIKFISSIAGIASSLFISALQRMRIRVFQQNLTKFCDLLEECTKYKSAEKILHDSFNEQSRQTQILNDMAHNIATSMNEVLTQQLASSVSHALEPLSKDIGILAHNFAQGSESTLHKMLQAFLLELHNNSTGHIQAVFDSADSLKNTLNDLAGHVESAGKIFNSESKSSAAQLEKITINLTSSFSQVQEGMAQFRHNLSTLEALTAHMEKSGQYLASAAQDTKTSAMQYSKTMAEMPAVAYPAAQAATENSDADKTPIKPKRTWWKK